MAQPPLQADQLSRLIDDLLALEQRLRLGRPSHRAVDDHEEEASRIADDLRGCSAAARPVLCMW